MKDPSPPNAAAITNKVPVQRADDAPEPPAPPIALPGGSVPSGRPITNPLGIRPRTQRAAYARELSVWPADEEFSDEFEIVEEGLAPVPPPSPEPSAATDGPSGRFPVGGSTAKSLGTLDRPRSDLQTAPSASIPPRPAMTEQAPEEPTLAPPRKGRPRVELRVPTGWSKSVSTTDIKRRKAKATPRPKAEKQAPAPVKRGLSSTQFLVIMTILAILNAPLIIVAGKYVKAFFAEEVAETEMTVEEIVRIELALEARPGDGEEILAEYGLDRHGWSALRGSVTADSHLNAQFQAIRARLQED